ncbi:hypothetical protein GWI33_003259, partial [Rhynchophorus ferrugineus]
VTSRQLTRLTGIRYGKGRYQSGNADPIGRRNIFTNRASSERCRGRICHRLVPGFRFYGYRRRSPVPTSHGRPLSVRFFAEIESH